MNQSKLLFKEHLPPNFFESNEIEYVETPKDATIFILPNNLNKLTPSTEKYIRKCQKIAFNFKKPFIIFVGGDFAHKINIPKPIIIFKFSQYRFLLKQNEIIMPAYINDCLKELDTNHIEVRKKSNKPTVGFCGFADLKTFQQKIKYYLKNIILDLKSTITLSDHYKTHKQGIYFRKKAIKTLLNVPTIKTNFIIRNFYSANKDTINISQKTARNDFIKNILESDFILAPKGDGNYSLRFFEILSLGRIPILIDTESVLPLEDEIDYNSFVLKVSYKDIPKLPEIISDFYQNISEEKFQEMQSTARKIFEQRLRLDSFFRYIFLKIL